ncbi:MAG TPA: DUF6046 domain-containing protein [Lacibacter sp.]|nr:DUF6046 domain-containing protein [Lacibacter sp.]
MAEFNIDEIFQNAFGYNLPKPFEISDADIRIEQSSLGQPMYMDDSFGREFFLPVVLDGLMVPFAVVSISCKKTIVKTALVERQGTVKELINTEDYVINIKGIIVRPDDKWPEDDIITLEKLFNKNQSVTLRNALTDIFLKGDYEHKVVVQSINFPAMAGIEHAKAFEIECESDAIFTLTVADV